MKLRATVRSVSASRHPPRNGITWSRSVVLGVSLNLVVPKKQWRVLLDRPRRADDRI
jgi:hypothetical protein